MSEKEEQLIKLINYARNRYDWLAYNKHFREYCELRVDTAYQDPYLNKIKQTYEQ
tara:strand:+ start:273 stop:437 length:165 start_codon:yes stop_codon:yes gene_type:complete